MEVFGQVLEEVHKAVRQLAFILLVKLWVSSVQVQVAKAGELLTVLDEKFGVLTVNDVKALDLG